MSRFVFKVNEADDSRIYYGSLTLRFQAEVIQGMIDQAISKKEIYEFKRNFVQY